MHSKGSSWEHRFGAERMSVTAVDLVGSGARRTALAATGIVAAAYLLIAVAVVLIVTQDLTSNIDRNLSNELSAMAAQRAAGHPFGGPPGAVPFDTPVLWWMYHPDGNYDDSSQLAKDNHLSLPVSPTTIRNAQTITISGTKLRVEGGAVGTGSSGESALGDGTPATGSLGESCRSDKALEDEPCGDGPAEDKPLFDGSAADDPRGEPAPVDEPPAEPRGEAPFADSPLVVAPAVDSPVTGSPLGAAGAFVAGALLPLRRAGRVRAAPGGWSRAASACGPMPRPRTSSRRPAMRCWGSACRARSTATRASAPCPARHAR